MVDSKKFDFKKYGLSIHSWIGAGDQCYAKLLHSHIVLTIEALLGFNVRNFTCILKAKFKYFRDIGRLLNMTNKYCPYFENHNTVDSA